MFDLPLTMSFICHYIYIYIYVTLKRISKFVILSILDNVLWIHAHIKKGFTEMDNGHVPADIRHQILL